jgi:hypothetical protein
MSYDIFCYHSKKGRPDLREAEALIESGNDTAMGADIEEREKIVKALLQECPALLCEGTPMRECLDRIAQSTEVIELKTPADDPAIQILIKDKYVRITIPYWYHGDKAQVLFQKIASLVKCLRESSGYFLYDPQTGSVSDPAKHAFKGLDKYLEVSEHWDQIASSKNGEIEQKKPWWKFW